jgi:hypothetical protein
MLSIKSAIVVVGCAVSAVAAPLVVAAPASATCPNGTAQTHWEGVCSQVGSSGPAYLPPSVQGPSANVVTNPNGVGSVNGIPCTPEHYGTCIALQQSGS